MTSKETVMKWVRRVGILLLVALLYLVYFTDLGSLQQVDNPQRITTYHQLAHPTLFVELRKAPRVKLDWVYADRNTMTLALNIRGLSTEAELSNWICDPYITTNKPIKPWLSRRDLMRSADNEGEYIQATYQYKIAAQQINSFTVDLDLTIGPCADYRNFQETNVIPTAVHLVGNYHLNFQVVIN